MTDGRKRITHALAALCLTALGGAVLVATPSHADPSIKSVQARVDDLYHQAEQASERYNGARERLAQARTRLAAVRADLHRERAKVRAVRQQVASAVVSEYQGSSLSSMKVFLSDDPNAFIDQLTTVSQYRDQQSQMMATFAVEAKRLSMRQQQASRMVAQVAATERQMAADKASIDKKASQAKALLQRLKDKAAARAAARAAAAARASRSTAGRAASPSPTAIPAPSAPAPSVPASGRAGAAVKYALAQVGKAYVYGASGPSAFDCSGLTMMAWRAAGVSLPHNSAAQMGYGTPVSRSQLQPGDLVFYYQPVSHVGMYIGNGKIVNAENPSVGVVVAPVDLMPYSGAVRIG